MGDIVQRYASTGSLLPVAGQGQRSKGHAVEPVGEGDHLGPARHLAGQFQRRLDGVRPRRSREHHLVVHVPRSKDHIVQRLEELELCLRGHIQAVGDPLGGEIGEQSLPQRGVVVTVVQRPRSGEEVDVLLARPVDHQVPPGAGEHRRERAYVASDIGLQLFDYLHGDLQAGGPSTDFGRQPELALAMSRSLLIVTATNSVVTIAPATSEVQRSNPPCEENPHLGKRRRQPRPCRPTATDLGRGIVILSAESGLAHCGSPPVVASCSRRW